MKHIINLIVSNPSHEFVSLRSKMHNKNFVVEAYDELEAINRATQKFRSLGFKVHSALVEQKVEIQKPVKDEPVVLSEAVDYKDLEKPTIKRIKSGETKPVDRTDYKVPPAMRKKKTSLESYLDDKKETQSIEEAAPQYIEEKLTGADPASKWIHDFVHSDNPMFDGKSKQERIRMALGAKYEKTNEMHNPMHNSLGRPDLDLRDHDTHDVVFSHTKGGMRILHLVKYKSKEDAEKFLSSVIEKGGKGIIRPPKNTNNDKPEKKHSFVRAIVGGKQIRTDEGNDDNKKLKLTKNKPPQVNVTPTLNSIEKDKV